MKKFLAIVLMVVMALSCAAFAEGNVQYDWSYIDWDENTHYAIQYINYVDGGASCSGYLEAHRWHTDEESGIDTCMLCGYVKTPEGVNTNTAGFLDIFKNSNLILPHGAVIVTNPVLPIQYVNTNEAIDGEFIVTESCYTAAWSATQIDANTVFEQMKYWGVDDYGNVTYEFIDAETGAVTFAHEGGFEVLAGEVANLDMTVENRTPASAIDAANVEVNYLVISEAELLRQNLELRLRVNEPGSTELCLLLEKDNLSLETLVIQPQKLMIHFVKSCSIRDLTEKDLKMASSVLILDNIVIPIVGESQDQDGTR